MIATLAVLAAFTLGTLARRGMVRDRLNRAMVRANRQASTWDSLANEASDIGDTDATQVLPWYRGNA